MAVVIKGYKEAAANWLLAFELPALPATGGKDLAGRAVRVVAFDSEETCLFFFPRRGLPLFQRMAKEVTATLRKRGAAIDRVRITPEDYARWQDGQGVPDSAELRFQYATRLPN